LYLFPNTLWFIPVFWGERNGTEGSDGAVELKRECREIRQLSRSCEGGTKRLIPRSERGEVTLPGKEVGSRLSRANLEPENLPSRGTGD